MSICLNTSKPQDRAKPMSTTNGTSHNPYSNNVNGNENGNREFISLSEDEEDHAMDSNSKEIHDVKSKIKLESNDIHQNEDCIIIEEDFVGNQLSVIRGLEKELRCEENTLLLFQHLKDSQKQTNGQKPVINNPNNFVEQKKPEPHFIPTNKMPNINSNSPKVPSPAIYKVTKEVALNAIEQQFTTKRNALKKHLEKTIDKIPLPSPKTNSGLSEIAFVPSSIVNEFSSLIGLEEVCKNIQEYETNSNKPEVKKVFNPFSCSRCKTDFTPVWKREKPGSAGVVCENCLVGNHKTNLHNDFETGIRNALNQYSNAEKELEKEYEELVKNPENLENFIKEHQNKLALAASQQTVNTLQRPNVHTSRVNKNNNLNYANNKLVYSNGNGNVNHSSATAYLAQNVSALQQQAQLISASLAATNTSHSSTSNGLQSLLSAENIQSLNPVQQAQLLSHLQAQAQQQQQQQQLVATLVAAANSGNSSNNAVLTSLVASMASQQQQAQQAQQLHQQQILASVIASIQQQQQQQQKQQAVLTSSHDQMSQLQNVLLSSIMGANNTQQNQRIQQNQSRQQQLQTLLQLSMLQQQAQVAHQHQQQQQAGAGLSPQHLALLQQMLQQSASASTTTSHSQHPTQNTPTVSNNKANNNNNSASSVTASNLASLNLLQSLQSLGNAAIKK